MPREWADAAKQPLPTYIHTSAVLRQPTFLSKSKESGRVCGSGVFISWTELVPEHLPLLC